MRKIQDRAMCGERSQHRPHLPQGRACLEAQLMEKVACRAPGLLSHHTSCAFVEATLFFDQRLGKKVAENFH